ncbi:hypothetical protein U8P76_02350 [Rhizobium johnstonii]|nr:hypothetical protein U8P76_02350 [Rhizobium johnstonii]
MRRSVNWRSAGRYFVWSRPIALTDEGERDHAKTALERAFAALRPDTRMTEEKIDAFARLMREKATQGPILSAAPTFAPLSIRSKSMTMETASSESGTFWNVWWRAERLRLECPVLYGKEWRTRRDSNS